MATAVSPAAYWRIVSFSVVAFDILQTFPQEIALYKRQIENRRVTLVAVLFAVNRYFGLLSLISNGLGYFSTDFTPESCLRFYAVPPTSKLIAAYAAMGIIFVRTWAIAKHSKVVLWILAAITIAAAPLLGVSNFINRQAVVGKGGNCTATTKDKTITFDWVPLYYLVTLIWDVLVCAIATAHLLYQARGLTFMAKFTRRVLRQGLLYCLGTAFANFMVYMSMLDLPGLSGLGASVNIAATMIMASRLVLHTYNLDSGSTNDSTDQNDRTWNMSASRSRSRPLTSVPEAQTQVSSHYGDNAKRYTQTPRSTKIPLSPMSPRFRPGPKRNGSLDRIEMGHVHVTTTRTTDFVISDKALDDAKDDLSDKATPMGESFMELRRGNSVRDEKKSSPYHAQ